MKKFPLEKRENIIGRGSGNDISLNEKDVSKKHCRVILEDNHLVLKDLNSRNGTYVGGAQISEAKIALNNSFGVGGTEFYFKKGDVREFKISRSLSDIYSRMAKTRRPEAKKEPDTELRGNRLEAVLQLIAEKALLDDETSLFMRHVRRHLEKVLTSGSLFFITPDKSVPLMDHLEISERELQSIGQQSTGAWGTIHRGGEEIPYWIFPSRLPGVDHFLVYFNRKKGKKDIPSTDFSQRLLEIIEVQMKLAAGTVPPAESLFECAEFSLVGDGPLLKKTVDLARKIAGKNSFILILGESGTGKELLAKMIHLLSGRKQYVALNCAAIPASLLESELFGYERGAFTDARQRKIGKIEEASGGTLVLDEIGDMPPEIQAKLLRVIQERSITRLGGNETIPVNLRIISMTNRNLKELVEKGSFRQDLFFRLRVHQLVMPPLRDHKEDIPHLIRHFTRIYSQRNDVAPAGFSESAESILMRYDWPGNVRELENEINRIIETIDDGELISRHHLLPDIIESVQIELPQASPSLSSSRQEKYLREKEFIEALLKKNNGNKTKTAREMGITYRGFLKKAKRLGIP